MGKFKVDENMPGEAVEVLVAAGHDACSVLDQRLLGVKDPRLAGICRDEVRCVVTLDLDFSDIRRFPPGDYAGIIVLRVSQQNRTNILAVIDRVVSLLGNGQPIGRLWVIGEAGVRVRT